MNLGDCKLVNPTASNLNQGFYNK